jgi:AcrR family transcriptional regulator
MSTPRISVKRVSRSAGDAAIDTEFQRQIVESPFGKTAGKAPQQARSRERVARILKASESIIYTHGVTELTMTAVARHAKVPIGSVYQYFPTKSALIHRLFQDRLYNYHVRSLERLSEADSRGKIARVVRALVGEIYLANRSDPFMRDIWGGAQADREIRHIHVQDNEFYTDLFVEFARRSGSSLRGERLRIRVKVLIEMWDGTIRLAIEQPEAVGAALINESINIGLRELGIELSSPI